MNIIFYVEGKKGIFKSKTAKKRLRNKLKTYTFFDLRNYWKYIQDECYVYLNNNICPRVQILTV